ncbi:hypothetical protein HGRIS_005331 [Hohenbuehelia grisea]|uniref:ferric-chelate reductase (NADPH) n=1 Tax=Hohenbuehelia grisea TaxID=104357 RepID=A0ABR3JFR6_9AGAR
MDHSHSDSPSNITDLPLSDPRCDSDACAAFHEGHMESAATISYIHQYVYGHYTTWFYLATIGVAMLVYASKLYRNHKPPKPNSGTTSITHKVLAVVRTISYRHAKGRIPNYFGFPSLGVTILLIISTLYLLLLTFLIHPYYRARRGYGSPAISTRTGLMAQALTPIIVALAGKVNLVTLLTGVSPEKLNIYHRFASVMCLFLSLVHTIPFLIQPVWEGGAARLKQLYYEPGAMELTGTPPIAILFGLVALSIPWIRNRFYNFFYRLHVPMAITYLGLMFWHSANLIDSWAYLWATLAVWGASILVRLFYKWQTFSVARSPWFTGFPASFKPLPGGMTRLTLLAPLDFTWRVGQHCWLRMPHLSILQNHPFTITNLPQQLAVPTSDEKSRAIEANEVVFYVRAHQGLSRDLLESVEGGLNDQRVSVHVDGPYGGLVEDIPALYETLIFVAGGSGIAACLPWIQHVAQRAVQGATTVSTVHLVWIVRQPSHLHWILPELNAIRSSNPNLLHLHLFVTDSSAGSRESKVDEDQSSEEHEFGSDLKLPPFQNERPYLPELIPSLATTRRVYIFGCGPESFRTDLCNAAAGAQKRVLAGQADVIALHTEFFGW